MAQALATMILTKKHDENGIGAMSHQEEHDKRTKPRTALDEDALHDCSINFDNIGSDLPLGLAFNKATGNHSGISTLSFDDSFDSTTFDAPSSKRRSSHSRESAMALLPQDGIQDSVPHIPEKKTSQVSFSLTSDDDRTAKVTVTSTSSSSGSILKASSLSDASSFANVTPRTARRMSQVSFALPEEEVAPPDMPIIMGQGKTIPTMGSFFNGFNENKHGAISPDMPPKMAVREDSLPSLDFDHTKED